MNPNNQTRPSLEKLNSFANELNELRSRTMQKVGEEDARYIRRLVAVQRSCEIISRILMVMGFISPILWVFAIILLALAKILDNMEIGHNVLHGQYDWMNDPHINSRKFEWDLLGDAGSWKRYHNHEHHTYTNVIGKDRDFGYGIFRLSDDLAWRPKNRFQLFSYIMLSSFFEWGIAYHEVAAERIFKGKKRKESHLPISRRQLRNDFFKKGARQLFKDYVFYPLICWPVAGQVLLGNLIANIIRNLWTSTIIFCGHFTEEIHTFTEEEIQGESQGEWYYRQILGSSNLEGSKTFHIMTGHLSCQIEHHLFPDVPARHYPAMASEVRGICQKYNIPYNTGRFFAQYSSVVARILRYSMPTPAEIQAKA
jgi:fatty acid desaturase